MTPTLLVLAAGVGSRFGAPKQLEPVGPGGATLVEYSIFDALGAGFANVVLVIRQEMQQHFAAILSRRFDLRRISFVAQDADPALAERAHRIGRTKPWGTAHAVLAASEAIDEPFVVINADDFYGRASYVAVSGWLRSGATSANDPTYALVSFPLAATLSPSGGVNRGVCEVTADGWLRSVREVVGIERAGEYATYVDEHGNRRELPGTTPVSMNMWAFTPRIFPELAARFATFLESIDEHPDRELLLPTTVNELIMAGRARVRVLPGGSTWAGMTYRNDVDAVNKMIVALTRSGDYDGF